jgi:hypothetical protein
MRQKNGEGAMKIIIKITAALVAALPIFLKAGGAVAQSGYPDRAVRMVVGYPPADRWT